MSDHALPANNARPTSAASPKKQMTSADLRNILFEQMLLLQGGDSTPEDAKAMASLAKEITASAKLDLEFRKAESDNQLIRTKIDQPIPLTNATKPADK